MRTRPLIAAPRRSSSLVFPDGRGAHRVRVRVDRPCKSTAYFMYKLA
jgi:hypothetical protein